ncbi:hypothetical protein VC273_17990 [Xanthomonas nasturtii]|uniref:hypothetical protein n=1 Tax=Xanthomonas TaxID=338 RepID=UPI002B235980|nr:hypothetical protein [Xanthomonas nasturtii]MEA9557715.1 hypothetical protein [Xanthomonas nasturtii]
MQAAEALALLDALPHRFYIGFATCTYFRQQTQRSVSAAVGMSASNTFNRRFPESSSSAI